MDSVQLAQSQNLDECIATVARRRLLAEELTVKSAIFNRIGSLDIEGHGLVCHSYPSPATREYYFDGELIVVAQDINGRLWINEYQSGEVREMTIDVDFSTVKQPADEGVDK